MNPLYNWVEPLLPLAQFAASIAVVVAALFTAAQVYFIYRQIKQQHKWHRLTVSQQYSFSHTSEIRKVTIRIRDAFKLEEKTKKGEKVIDLAEVSTIFGSNPDLRADWQFIMGRLEAMCAAMEHEIVDEQFCKDLHRGSVIKFYNFFQRTLPISAKPLVMIRFMNMLKNMPKDGRVKFSFV